MSDQYIGEIRTVPYTFAPVGWLFCDGSLQNISTYEALYALIGTTYGGDGQTTFGLPDFRGRVPMHQGPGFSPGSQPGSETVTLNANQLGLHSHPFYASNSNGTLDDPTGNYLAGSGMEGYYTADTSAVAALNVLSMLPSGGSGAHNNMMPFQCVNFIIATEGIYPTPA